MKLIIAIVQDEDASKLLSKLMKNGFSATKLATTGGFLKAGNTTLLLGIDEEKTDTVIGIIESVCKCRKQLSSATTSLTSIAGSELSTFPLEVTVGGATLFVLSVDRFLKV